MAMQTPYAMDCGRNTNSASQMLGWTVLRHGAEALDSGFSPSTAEDKRGLSYGGTERDGTLKVNSLNATSSLKHFTIPHPPGAGGGPQEILFLVAPQEAHFYQH